MLSQADLAAVLVRRLDEATLTAVIAQLLGHAETDAPLALPQHDCPVRVKDFRRLLGNPSKGKWQQLREQGLIPPGTKISPQIEIWTREQVVETIARLAELQREREKGR